MGLFYKDIDTADCRDAPVRWHQPAGGTRSGGGSEHDPEAAPPPPRGTQDRGWSQRELSARANVSQTRLSKYENGTHQVPLGALIRIARALALPVDALLPDTGDMPRDPEDVQLLARLRSLVALGSEEKAVACSLLDTVLAMRELRQAWQARGPHGTRD